MFFFHFMKEIDIMEVILGHQSIVNFKDLLFRKKNIAILLFGFYGQIAKIFRSHAKHSRLKTPFVYFL